MDSKAFRALMGQFLSGVTVITATVDGEVHGMTASAFVSVSMDPPLVLVSVQKTAHMHAHFDGRPFAVSILRQGQEAVSNHFAGWKKPEFTPTFADGLRTPVISGALAALDLDLHATYDGGDHSLFVGRIVGHVIGEPGMPLAYFAGKYGKFGV